MPITRAHRGDDLEQQAGPVGERAAVLVGALVGGGREEAAHDRRVAALQLDAVEAALGAVLGDDARSRRRSRRSRPCVTALGTSRNSGSATGDGAHTGRREYIDDAWPPLWLIWAKIGVRWRCTASVMRR